jgi:hypothetical protein
MELRNFFIGRAMVLCILLIVGLGIWGYKTYFSRPTTSEVVQPNTEENKTPPTFIWKYKKSSTLNLDGKPNTDIFLEVTYSNGKIQSKLIDTTPGGCNDLPDLEKDSVSNSTVIQCYYAGLGYLFKVTKGETTYFVQRKIFEETSPDYSPTRQKYETVAEFPFEN